MDQEGTKIVQVIPHIFGLLQHGLAGDERDPTHYHPFGISLCVGVDSGYQFI